MDRIRELDGVRGLAAVVILIYHLRPGGTIPLGWAAVDIFFVLSGYLITTIILKHMGSHGFLRAFYIRRGLRIWPPYLLAIAALVLLDGSIGDRLPLAYLPSFLTFTQGMPWLSPVETPFPSFFGHSWTLAIEEQFYLVWPALLVIFRRRSVLPLAVAFLGLSLGARALGAHPYLLVSRCDGFAAGAILASMLADPSFVLRHRNRLRWGFGASAAIFLAVAAERLAGPSFGFPEIPGSTLLMLNLLFACLIGLMVLGSGSAALALLRTRPIVYLGQISYGLYLYHALVYFVVFVTAQKLGFGASLGRDAVAFGLTFLSAAVSWRCLERPLLSLKDRFPYEAKITTSSARGRRSPLQELSPTT